MERLRPVHAPERPARADRADAAGAVGVLRRDARRRLALRDAPRRTGSRTSRSTCSSRAPSGGRRARDLASEIDAIGGEFNAFTGKEYTGYYVRCAAETRDIGARRARRHAPQLALRPRGDRAREGRDHRGDEHVLRHAARLHRRRLRVAPLRRPAARLGHHRPEGDGPRGARARRSPSTSTTGTGPSRMVVGVGGQIGDGAAGTDRGAARRPRAARDRRAGAGRPRRERLAREGAHEAVRPGAHRARRAQPPARRSGPVRPPAARDRARRRHVVAALHGGA